MITVNRKVHIRRIARGRKQIAEEPPASELVEPGRIPRISRLMALAISFEKMLRDGEVTAQSDLARLAHVSQPRITQIMNLLHLAPDIQEKVLFLPRIREGRDPITERDSRPIAFEVSWRRHREVLGGILARLG